MKEQSTSRRRVNDYLDPNFETERTQQVEKMRRDTAFLELSEAWFKRATDHSYSYHFDVLGRPIIQFPQDIVATNELIWQVRPDIVIETGIARGGSIVNTAAQLAMLDLSEAEETPEGFSFRPQRKVLAIDIDIRTLNRLALENHFLSPWFDLIEGSSIASDVTATVFSRIPKSARVMVLLDSGHTHDHVLEELRSYAPLVTAGSYCVVYDTVIENMPDGYYVDRPWNVGNNPATAIREFLAERADFVVDETVSDKLMVSVAPGGYLKRVDN